MDTRDYLILFMCVIVIFLDLYVMKLDAKVKKLQAAMKEIIEANKDMAKSNRESCEMFGKLAAITKDVNNQVGNLINLNSTLCQFNDVLVKTLKEEQEGK